MLRTVCLTFLTDFADQAVVLPLALVVALVLALTGWKRGAFIWLLAVLGTIGTIALLKIAFATCGPAQFGGVVKSPSGHTASAAIIYGGLIALIGRRWGASIGWAFLAAPVAVLVIGLSRVELGAHTLPEVVIGGVIGCAGVLAVLVIAGAPPPRLHSPRLIGPAVFVAVVMHGNHLHGEDQIRAFAGRYAWLASVCFYHGPP